MSRKKLVKTGPSPGLHPKKHSGGRSLKRRRIQMRRDSDTAMDEATQKADVRHARIGYIGVGDMGGPMAVNLAKAGFTVKVYDLRESAMEPALAAGAQRAADVANIARTTDVIHICVVYNEQVADVVLGEGGLLANGRSGQILIVHSTVGPKFLQDCAQAAKAKGIDLIDAAVSGGRSNSIDGTLTLMLGGEASVVNYCMPLFRVVGKHIFHVGDVGAGQAVKVVNNVMAGVHRLIYLEALSIATAYGVSESSVNDVVSVSSGMSWWQMNMAVLDNRPKSHAHMGIDELPYRFTKDLRHAIEVGNDKRLSLPLTALAAQIAPALYKKRFESVT